MTFTHGLGHDLYIARALWVPSMGHHRAVMSDNA